jgi:PKD repeat protein
MCKGMKARFIFFFFFYCSLSILSAAELTPGPKMVFEENKNQWPSQVAYATDFAGGKLFFEKNAFTYLLTEHTDFHDFEHKNADHPKIRYHAFKVNFQNSNPAVGIVGNDSFSFHRNYYIGNDPSHWAEGVKLYDGVWYKNLYPAIDMKVYSTEKNLKYDLIVEPGGVPNDIKFKYTGTDSLYIESGSLFIKTSLGYIVEQKPYAYQMVDGVKKEIACSYQLNGTTLSFVISKKYNKTIPLTIDPTLIASTYTGSFADNWGFTATYDAQGNIYSAGIAASAGYPTTIGAFDNTFNGGMPWTNTTYPYDISIIKYNATGSAIMFSTYYGGFLNEQPHSLFVNNNNELYVTGRTNSPNFPTTVGAYDVSYNGGYDIIVGKFNASGALLGSTFVGGTGDDGVNIIADEFGFGSLKFNYADDGRSEIVLDNTSNVYVAGSTRSTNFPTTAGAYDATLGGAQDGCVFKMTSTLSSLVFSTYVGGSADDAAYGIKMNTNNSLYITGGTSSTDFPTTAGVLHTTYQGGMSDGFITALNSTGTALLYSTYLGTSAYDQSYLIETDANNDIYVFGQTKGAYPVTSGVYNNPNSSQFIHKLTNQLNATVFSTVIGKGTSNPNISPTAFLVDSCQSIYISGWGRCPMLGHPFPSNNIGMPITPNAFQSTTDGCDFYFMVLRPNASSLLYATYFGENSPIPDHVDGGTSRFDKRGFIYQAACASCGGFQQFPTTPTAWSRTNNSFNCNNAVVKMDLQVNVDAVANLSVPPTGCVPYTITCNISGSIGTNYKWDFGDGSPISSVAVATHTYTNVGKYTALLIVSDSTGTCNKFDTAKIIINVVGPPTLVTSQTSVFCNAGNNGTATVIANGASAPFTYLWSNGQTNATATALSANTYTVTVSNSLGCSSTATATVTQPNALSVNSTFTNVGCFGGSDGTATANGLGGTGPYTYVWLPGGYTTSSVTGLSIGNYTVNVTDAKGCTVSTTANITQPPALVITATTVASNCGQANGSATVTGAGGFAPYSWTWSGGQVGAAVNGLAAGTYTITIHDANLCTASMPVSIANIAGPSASIMSTGVSCKGLNDGSATIVVTSGTPPYTYLWNNGQTTPTATNLGVGIYSVVATDANNCSATTNVTITEPSALVANAIVVNPTCFGFTDGSAQVSPLGGTAPYNYSWAINGNPTTATISNIGAGIYNVTVTDAHGCIQLVSATLTNPTAVSISITNTRVSCADTCDGSAVATITNGFSPYTYLWSDATHQATAIATSLCAATYSLSVTDAHGCSANAVTTIDKPAQLTVSVVSKGNASCNGLCDGFAQVAPSGGTPPYNFNWSNGATNATATGLCADSVKCNVTDNNGCRAMINDSITQPAPITGAVNIVKTPCNNTCDGEIMATYSGGTLPYNYLWQPGLQTTNNPKGLCAGVNTINLTDANGCLVSGSIDLVNPPALSVSVTTTSSICGQANGGACVVVSGGTPIYKYAWNTSPVDSTSCISNVLANTYNVKVEDAMGCISITTANINNITGLNIAMIDSTAVSCYGLADGAATAGIIGGNPPYTLFWTPGGQTVLNPTNLSAGVNTLTATDSMGCVVSTSVQIATPTKLVSAITGKQNVSCFGVCDGAATVLYGGGTPPLAVVWSAAGNPTTANVSGLCAGTYTVTITDFAGCTRIDSSTIITQPSALLITNSTTSNISCFGDNNGSVSAIVSGGTPVYTFNWTANVSASATASNLVAGNYTLNVMDKKNCSATQTWTITEPSALTISNSSNPAACSFSNGDATVISAGGTVPYTYQWNDIAIQTTAQAHNLAAGNYICVVRDSNSCTIADTITVLSIPGPVIDSTTSTSVLCNGGNTGAAQVYTASGLGTLPFTYLWSPSAQTTATATNLSQGAYNVLVTDANGCTTNGTVVVTQPSALAIVISPADTVCFGDATQVYAQAVGGTPNYTYTWLGASGVGLVGGGPHLITITANTSYSVSVTDANNCPAGSVSTQFNIPPPLNVLAIDTTICDGSSGTISVNASGGNGGPYTYSWSNGATTQSQQVNPVIGNSPVSYSVTVSDGCSPTASDSATVTVVPKPTGSFTQSDTTGCEPLTVNFNGLSPSVGATFIWNWGDGTTSSGASSSHTFTSSSAYSVTMAVTSAAGCSSIINGTNTITVNPLPLAGFSANPNPASPMNPTVNFTDISSTTITSWLWSFNDSTSTSS